jgi:ferric-dicitrate binding protein FerR (iron transport regulator)
LTAGTTNGTLFATNSTRNYLLVQCTSGTVFIDTNGTASATDDIQLTAGQGITFEGSFVPTGAIAAITSAGTARIIGVQG